MSELPAGWIKTQLGEVADWGSGGTPKADIAHYYGGGIPWAVIGDLNDGSVGATARTITDAGLSSSGAKMVDDHTVLVAMYGSIGKLGLPTIPMATNQAIAFARPKHGVVHRLYLFYYLMHARDALTTAGKGATQQNISQTVLKAWPIALAPLAEQKRIVAAVEKQFSRLDAGAAVLERVRLGLGRMRASLLRAATNGSLIGERSGAWPTRRLDGVATIASGQTPRGLSVADTGPIPYFRVGDMNAADGRFMGGSRTYVTQADADAAGLHIRPAGTVIFPKRGGAIATNKKRILAAPAAYDLNTMGLVPGPDIDPAFLYAWISSIDLNTLADGSNVPQINHGDLRDIAVALPSKRVQGEVVERLSAELERADRLESFVATALRRSARLRSAVLSAAFSGRLITQDLDHESASELLHRIVMERASSTSHDFVKTRSQRRRKAAA